MLLFTAYSWPEVVALPGADALLAGVDVLIAGRYVAARRVARGLRGSANLTIHLLTPLYSLPDLEAAPEAKVVIGREGDLSTSCIQPLCLD